MMRLKFLLLVCLLLTGCEPSPANKSETAQKGITNSLGMKLSFIPKGKFTMGAPKTSEGRDDEVQREVEITKDFYLGTTEVTQAQYQKVMGLNPSHFQGEEAGGESANHPVEMVTWENAVEFCKRLSELPEEKAANRVYRLPTEAEWEYACRAGSTTPYFFGADPKPLGEYAWFGENCEGRTHPVGTKKPNAWGLFDMYGNVWEWCADWHGPYPPGNASDPKGPEEGASRVCRGGTWLYDASTCRSSSRDRGAESYTGNDGGFRILLEN